MYYSYFGLDQPPFRITPNTEFFFGGGNRGAILEALIYAVTQGEGMVKVTGEVGSGKTMLCNMLQARLPGHVDTVYLAHPSVQPEEILHAIAFELELGITPGTSRLETTLALQRYLLERHAAGRRVVVFVEESQNMPVATLEEIRLLSNLETRDDKLLQIVLFGQPELDVNLSQPAIRQLRERITHSFRLEPLTAAEIHEYLMFRMRTAGYRGPDLFPRSVVRQIARASQGLTRRVNLIADKALLAAFSENTHNIRARHVAAAVRDSEFSQYSQQWWQSPMGRLGLATVGSAVVGAAAFALLQVGGSAQNAGGVDSGSVAVAQQVAHPPAAPHEPATTEVRSAAKSGASALAAQAASEAAQRSRVPAAPAHPVGAPADAGLDNHGSKLLDERLAATQRWLARVPRNAFTIQLLEAEHGPQLVRELQNLANSIEMDSIFLYRSGAKRRATLGVSYGSFSDRRAAQDALDSLPPALKANRPFLRTAQGILTEIR